MSASSTAIDRQDHAYLQNTDQPQALTQVQTQQLQHLYRDYGGNPLAHLHSDNGSIRLPAFGGAFQPGLYKPPPFKFGNPVPMGLAGFALTTFVLSLVNLGCMGVNSPALVIGPAYVYGGFLQILAGMWEMALGNVFGATALTSYGGFWIGVAIILTPGGFGIQDAYGPAKNGDFYVAFGFYIFAWFIFTFLLWLLTLRSTVAFCSLFLMVWLSFICLGVAYIDAGNSPTGSPNMPLVRAGGAFGIVAGFLAWYNMLAGLLDPSNSFFIIPVFHFPWSEKGREDRRKKKDDGSEEV